MSGITIEGRVHVLIRTWPSIRPDTPTWAGENAGTQALLGMDINGMKKLYREGDYTTLERCMSAYAKACSELRDGRPNLWAHLAAWYWTGTAGANPAYAAKARKHITRLMEASGSKAWVPKIYYRDMSDGKDDRAAFKAFPPRGEEILNSERDRTADAFTVAFKQRAA